MRCSIFCLNESEYHFTKITSPPPFGRYVSAITRSGEATTSLTQGAKQHSAQSDTAGLLPRASSESMRSAAGRDAEVAEHPDKSAVDNGRFSDH